MRNLIAFVLRYQGVMLFVLLEVVSLFLFVTNSTYQRAAFFNSANAYAGALLTRRTEVTDYFRLNELNQQLIAENSRLRQQLFPPDYARREADSLPVGRDTLGRVVYRHLHPYPEGLGLAAHPAPTAGRYPDSLLLGGTKQATHDAVYPLVPARVVNNSLRNVDNYLTLNVGLADGVQPGLGVVAAAGVVGRVKAVSEHYATVTSLLHSKTAVAARIQRDGTFGSVTWDGEDYRYAQLDYIPRQNKLVRGDTVVTSGYNAVYPEGVFIGTIESFVKEPDKNFWTVQLRLGTDFSRLTYVYVVHSRPRLERDSLEATPTVDPAKAGATVPAAATGALGRTKTLSTPAAKPTAAPAKTAAPAAASKTSPPPAKGAAAKAASTAPAKTTTGATPAKTDAATPKPSAAPRRPATATPKPDSPR